MYYAVVMEKKEVTSYVTDCVPIDIIKGEIKDNMFISSSEYRYGKLPFLDYYDPEHTGEYAAFPIYVPEYNELSEEERVYFELNYYSDVINNSFLEVKVFSEYGLEGIEYICNNNKKQLSFPFDVHESINDNKKTEDKSIILVEKEKKKEFNEIYKALGKRVMFQDKAIRQILTAIESNLLFNNPKLKSNILVIGSTGTGKTEIFRAISELMDIPLYIADSKEYTTSGYVGKNVEDAIQRLFVEASFDKEKAENGILIFDEIDKLCDSSNKRSVGTTDVLDSLLKVIEGKDVLVKSNNSKYTINTSKMTFVALGAFSDMDKIVNNKNFGFISNGEKKDSSHIDNEALIKYGLTREFVGRINCIVQMNELGLEELKTILLESSVSILRFYIEEFNKLEIPFIYNDEVIDYIVEKAYLSKTGARGLYTVAKGLIEDELFNHFNSPNNFTEIDISKKMILRGR